MEHVSRGLEIQDGESLGGYTKNHDANVEYKKSKMFHSLALSGTKNCSVIIYLSIYLARLYQRNLPDFLLAETSPIMSLQNINTGLR